jgi:thiamine biosynthesis protein ThiI
MDKVEIIEHAKQIETYDISIEPDEDCCSYLMPRQPATWAHPEELEEIESTLDVKELVASAVAGIEVEQVEPRP